MQNLRRFHHLQHEGGLRIGQVVSRADAGVDGVNRSESAGAGRHITAHAGQQHNHRNLAHVGRFAAHVGPSDDLHALFDAEARVVGDKSRAAGLIQTHLYHRMAAGADVDARLQGELRCAPVQRERALGQGAQHVECGQRARHPRQRRHEGLQLVEQLFKQPFFARQRPLLGAQGFVLKSLQFGRNEALGVLEGLTAAVIVRHLVDLALRDLNVKAMHLVELHSQVGNAGAGLFASFQIEQKSIAVGLDGAQLVEFGIEPGRNHVTIADQCGGLFHDGGRQQGSATGWGQQMIRNLRQIGL